MAYGLKFDGVNGQTIFDTDKPLEFLTINGGTVSTGTSTSFEADTDILFCRPVSGTSFIATTAYPTNYPNSSSQTVNVTFEQNTSFFKVRRTSEASNIGPPSGQYGLVVYDGTGTNDEDIIFSTIKTQNAIDIIGTGEAGRASGNSLVGIWHNSTVFSGATSGVYVSVSYANYFNNIYPVQCYIFNSNSIVFNSTVAGPFGPIPLPLFGQIVLAKVQG